MNPLVSAEYQRELAKGGRMRLGLMLTWLIVFASILDFAYQLRLPAQIFSGFVFLYVSLNISRVFSYTDYLERLVSSLDNELYEANKTVAGDSSGQIGA